MTHFYYGYDGMYNLSHNGMHGIGKQYVTVNMSEHSEFHNWKRTHKHRKHTCSVEAHKLRKHRSMIQADSIPEVI